MSERKTWRPTPAPKPQISRTAIDDKNHAAALRGATAAFTPTHTGGDAAPPKATKGAISAATAGHARAAQGNATRGRSGLSPARGRSQLTLDLQKASDRLQQTSIRGDSDLSRGLQRTTSSQPHALPLQQVQPLQSYALQRTASEIAARAASTNASPTRGGLYSMHLSQSPARSSQSDSRESQSREASVASRGRRDPEIGSQNALAGATASMSRSPARGTTSPYTTETGKLDIRKIPSLIATPSSPEPHAESHQGNASLSAARSASQGAEVRLRANSRPRSPRPTPRSVETDPVVESSTTELQKPSPPPSPVPRKDSLAAPGSMLASRLYREKSNTQPHLSKYLHQSKPIPIPPRQQRASPAPSSSPASASPRPSTISHPRGMTANSLANAMVSASIASTRISSSSRPSSPPRHKAKQAPPAPIPRHPRVPYRRSSSASAINPYTHTDPNPHMRPLPARPMRTTLRQQSSDIPSAKEEKRGRKHRLRKHPNMHHEGARKRWRDTITQSERKRYEGVWAANKGLFLEYDPIPPASAAARLSARDTPRDEMVLNVVVRDIWERSRLPRDALEEVWDLVTEGEEMRFLNREQFVVGLWLIDLRLKGRKLPVRVSPSAWASVRHMGVRVRSGQYN